MFMTSCSLLHHGQYYFNASATLMTFMLLGKLLENIAKGKTSKALLKLMDLQPKDVVCGVLSDVFFQTVHRGPKCSSESNVWAERGIGPHPRG